MNLEEHIKRYDDRAKSIRNAVVEKKESQEVVELLRELKALKENDDVKDVFMDCDTCKYLSLECDDYPCDRCCHRYNNQYVYDDKREVNADGR
jgi:hypothetical protein